MALEKSKKFLNDKGYVDNISFKPGEPRVLEIVKEKRDTITGSNGEEVDVMIYLVKDENDEPKKVITSSVALIGGLVDLDFGDKVKIEQRKYKAGGEFRTTYDVEEVGTTSDDIPTVEEDGGFSEREFEAEKNYDPANQ